MRIQSPFRDYYDGIATMFHNKEDKLYIRITKEIPKQYPVVIRADGWYFRPAFGLLYFCGKKYCGIYANGAYCFTPESLRAHIDVITDKTQKSSWLDPPRSREKQTHFDRCVLFMEKNSAKVSHNIFLQYDTPILWGHYEPSHHWKDGLWVRNPKGGWILQANPCLKDISGVPAFLDPHTVAQEIDMFLNGVLVDHPKPPVEISDENRITAHGFDSKWSFRKHKDDPK